MGLGNYLWGIERIKIAKRVYITRMQAQLQGADVVVYRCMMEGVPAFAEILKATWKTFLRNHLCGTILEEEQGSSFAKLPCFSRLFNFSSSCY